MGRTVVGRDVPVTGPRAASHEDAERLKRVAQESLDERNRGKRAAALQAHGVDKSRENADRAKRERWSTSGASPGQGTPRQ